MTGFQHERHKPPTALDIPRPLIVAVAPLRSGVNLARIVRTAGCCGVTRVISCGSARIDPEIARDSLTVLTIERHRSLAPCLTRLKQDGYQLVGLEQTTGSQCLYDFRFQRRTVLVIGNERTGLVPEVLKLLDAVVEIPIYGRPFSHNVATAAAMALYEYCRQFPQG